MTAKGRPGGRAAARGQGGLPGGPRRLLPLYVAIERTHLLESASIAAELNRVMRTVLALLRENRHRESRLCVVQLATDISVLVPLVDPHDLVSSPEIVRSHGIREDVQEIEAQLEVSRRGAGDQLDLAAVLPRLGDRILSDAHQLQIDGFNVLPPVCLWIVAGANRRSAAAERAAADFAIQVSSLSVFHVCVVAASHRRSPLPDVLEPKTYHLSAGSNVVRLMRRICLDLLRQALARDSIPAGIAAAQPAPEVDALPAVRASRPRPAAKHAAPTRSAGTATSPRRGTAGQRSRPALPPPPPWSKPVAPVQPAPFPPPQPSWYPPPQPPAFPPPAPAASAAPQRPPFPPPPQPAATTPFPPPQPLLAPPQRKAAAPVMPDKEFSHYSWRPSAPRSVPIGRPLAVLSVAALCAAAGLVVPAGHVLLSNYPQAAVQLPLPPTLSPGSIRDIAVVSGGIAIVAALLAVFWLAACVVPFLEFNRKRYVKAAALFMCLSVVSFAGVPRALLLYHRLSLRSCALGPAQDKRSAIGIGGAVDLFVVPPWHWTIYAPRKGNTCPTLVAYRGWQEQWRWMVPDQGESVVDLTSFADHRIMVITLARTGLPTELVGIVINTGRIRWKFACRVKHYTRPFVSNPQFVGQDGSRFGSQRAVTVVCPQGPVTLGTITGQRLTNPL